MVGVEISLKISINKNAPPGHGPCTPTHTSLGAALGDAGKAAFLWPLWTLNGRPGAPQCLLLISMGRSPWSSPVLFSVISDLILSSAGASPLSYLLVLLFHHPQIFPGLLCLGANACSLTPLPSPGHIRTHTCTHTCELVSNTKLGNPPALLFLV